jgi:UDP-N-acetylglucosamine diphosphorylase/glucosamine-1-phosphate N-acetyltransferase
VNAIFFYDDAAARALAPFSLTRPACELRAGALLVRERWERALGLQGGGFVGAEHLRDFDEPGAVRSATGVLRKGTVVVNARCAVALDVARSADVWRCDGRVAAVTLDRDVDAAELRAERTSIEGLARTDGREAVIAGVWMDHVWDFIAHLAPMLSRDIMALSSSATRREVGGSITGPHGVFTEDGATVEPHVYFDTTAGPVLIRRKATILAFTRIVGPCVIGEESQVGGDKIAASSIGNVCKVHGELSATILLGHSNKGHDGFVGHSYLGRWVNLGAGTITSNLKNTYGTVQLWTPEGGGEQDTGQLFIGTMFGDHVKTGIGTSLTTGTVIGAEANIYGSTMPPKVVPPFAWGDEPPYSTYRIDKFLEVARRVMQRRHVDLSVRQSRQLTAAYELREAGERGAGTKRAGAKRAGTKRAGTKRAGKVKRSRKTR